MNDDEMRGVFVDAAMHGLQSARDALVAGDWTRLAFAVHQVKGLCAQAGELALAQRLHEMEDLLTTPSQSAASPQLAAELDAVAAAVVGCGAAQAPMLTAAAGDVAERILRDMRTIAARRGVTLTVRAVEVDRQMRLPHRTAGLLFDVLGHLARNAVAHGGAQGRVAVDLAITVDGGGLHCRLWNSAGGRAEGTADLDRGRGLGRAAAAARVNEAGGTLTYVRDDHGHLAEVVGPVEWLQTGQWL